MTITPDAVLGEGPYVWSVVHDHITSHRPAGRHQETRPVKLPLFVTVPMASTPSSNAPAGPFPVCVLLNGFQARASYYAPLARRLASWGVMVLQYNAPALTIIPDAAELPFLGEAVSWLKQATASDAQPSLQGRADLNRLVIAGHSRGGKLAALHYSAGSAADVPIRAAFLIDPVDNTAYTPESADYPSATKALRAADKPFGMAAAGVISQSNPDGSNWKLFEATSAPGSWLMMLKRAGHTTFMKPPTCVEAFLLDKVFGGGPMDRETAMSQTAAAMLAWFGQQLSPFSTTSTSLSTTQQAKTAAGGGGSSLQAITSSAPVPIAASAMHAAAAAVVRPAAGLHPAGAAVSDGDVEGAGEGAVFSDKLAVAFQQWVTSPAAEGVEFRIK